MFRVMVSHARKHPSLIPLFLIIGSGGIGAALYVMRLAVFNPDVCWDKKNNPEPWNKLAPNDQYKVFGLTLETTESMEEHTEEQAECTIPLLCNSQFHWSAAHEAVLAHILLRH